MIDLAQEKNSTTTDPKSSSTTPLTAAATANPSSIVAPEESKGEKLYNTVVYKGINYWLNLGLSIVAADIFLYGKGRPFYDKQLENVTNFFKSTKLDQALGEEATKRASDVALGFTTLNTGGNIILIPMKLMEDAKRPIVHWINKNIYHDKQLAADGHEKTPDEIYIEQEQPKQSWGNVIWRRAQAMAASIAFGLTLDAVGRKKLDVPIIEDGKTITHINGTDRFTNWVVDNVTKVMNSDAIPGGKVAIANPTIQHYVGFAALDTFNTMITSFVMHKTNGAQKAKLPREIGDEVDPPGVAATDEIVLLPKGEDIVDTTKPTTSLDHYKKKAPQQPAAQFTDRLQTSNGAPALIM